MVATLRLYWESVRAAVLVLVVTACYSPSAPLAIPCGEGGACPSGQVCDVRTDRCGAPGDVVDDAAPADAMVDGTTTDATTDAMIDAPSQNVTGCADGQREAFASLQGFPSVAGCAATWTGMPSLRAPVTGTACGDDLGVACAVPADACQVGWHVCGTSGAVAEIAAIQPTPCMTAGSGRFVAAMSHCANNVGTCEYAATLPCYDADFCSEPVCCGDGCITTQGCTSGVWADTTPISASDDMGCNMMPAAMIDGVMCCKN